ncbi:MAG: malectin domain-containing carbohydrate-binding protein [Candidatus Solibacter sp.]
MCDGETGFSKLREQEIQAELARLLESPAFRTSKRCREFLEYIIEHTIRGPSGALKERSIGVELFQLAQDFDTGQHTIVRVTANEVRKKLAQHYQAENGAFHAVRIDLPPGSYSAAFRWEAPAVEAPVVETPSAPAPAEAPVRDATVADLLPAEPNLPARPNWLRPRSIAATLFVLLLAGAFSLWRWWPVNPASVDAKTPAVSNVSPTAALAGENLRMIAGATVPYVDRGGRTWGPDRYFTGGNVIVRPSERIYRTLDPDIYRHLRTGDFRYDIPLRPGNYELHLFFAETGLADFISAESSGEGQRLFRVFANGRPLLPAFDVVADAAGSNIADERVFRNISPAEDGFLHLNFNSMRSTAMLSGIEVLPVSVGKAKPVRIRAGWTSSWQDSANQEWQADSYFLGGNALVRTTNPVQESTSTASDKALYASERWGHFSYAIPVAEGRYRVTLKFSEGHYGKRNAGAGEPGGRVFDVYSNGVALLKGFDIMKEAGGEGRPIDRNFSGIRPNAQGKILLTFVPVQGMACVNGIEVVDDSK